MKSLESVTSSIWHHFSVMTPFILAVTLLKFCLPVIFYLANRIFEYKSAKNLMKKYGFSETEAKDAAKKIWRKPLPKWLQKLISIIRKNHHP